MPSSFLCTTDRLRVQTMFSDEELMQPIARHQLNNPVSGGPLTATAVEVPMGHDVPIEFDYVAATEESAVAWGSLGAAGKDRDNLETSTLSALHGTSRPAHTLQRSPLLPDFYLLISDFSISILTFDVATPVYTWSRSVSTQVRVVGI
eukprot:GHVU01126735.1.p2 GENE.GHVU01126735.1~~GHVU01126735.1.p2  ORF type:complete len:148 (+),score=18.81 GHVU01126735.1:264-707(+)